VQFELLGPLRVVEGDSDVTPARPKQRALLSLLLLRRGEVVPRVTSLALVYVEFGRNVVLADTALKRSPGFSRLRETRRRVAGPTNAVNDS
jgi:hypothetical protein